jgi:hypothetical protein
MRLFFGIFFILTISILGACSSQDIENQMKIESQIKIKINDDAQFLATLDAIYLLAFVNVKDNMIRSDDIYMRIDRGTISHGFDLDKIKVQVIQEGESRILRLQLPPSKKIALNREMVLNHNVHKKYKPLDDNGKEIDVALRLTKELNEVDQKYNKQTQIEIRKMTEQYFDGLAKKFGLQRAEIEFL